MIMITGGAYQGKREFARQDLKIAQNDMLSGEECSFTEPFNAPCVFDYHLLIKRLDAEAADPIEYTQRLIAQNPNIVIIMDEVGCGIVPMQKSQRRYRELVGNVGCLIAKNSDAVVRVNCGIAVCIKGEIR